MNVKYLPFGNTGINVSNLGFGCMRLPMIEKDGKEVVNDELAIPLLQKAVELGINFFDSHWFYCNYDSQRVVGKALRDVRDQVYISTKIPMWLVTKTEDFMDYLERALEQMGLEYLDFYHLPHLSYPEWRDKILPLKLLDEAEKAKSKGLIKHLSFSFHSDVDKMHELIDTGAFSTVMGQYNLADMKNEGLFAYAKEKGLGTLAMVPLMGGVLSEGGQSFLDLMESDYATATELGLRFVWSQPNIDVLLSGMSSIPQLEENISYANDGNEMSADTRQALINRAHALNALDDLYCTDCRYCFECPKGIPVGMVFTYYLQHHVWGLTDAIRARRGKDGLYNLSKLPSECTSCGHCVKRCPQKIDIPTQLERVWNVLQNL